MTLKVIAVGRKHESWVIDGIERYQKRLRKPFDIEWVILPHSHQDGLVAAKEESKRIALRLADDDFLILLDERGDNIDSPALSSLLHKSSSRTGCTVFVIGGAYGVDETIHKRANFIWSLSKLVFPHQLVRLILAEQIYRAQEIKDNRPYHHT